MLYSGERVLIGVIMVLSDATGGVQPGYYGDEEERMGSCSPVIKKAALTNVDSRREPAIRCVCVRVCNDETEWLVLRLVLE